MTILQTGKLMTKDYHFWNLKDKPYIKTTKTEKYRKN